MSLCWCCCYTIRDGSRVISRARYEWTFELSGNVTRLCEECCAAWRANAEADPSLAPSRIRELTA
jgi:hypothetical protein